MSVMNGFRTELINKIVGFNPHITVKSYDKNGIDLNKLDNNNLKLIKTCSILYLFVVALNKAPNNVGGPK